MTNLPKRTWLAVIGVAVLLALVVTLASGAWAPRAAATPRGAVQLGVTPAAVSPLTVELHLGASHGEFGNRWGLVHVGRTDKAGTSCPSCSQGIRGDDERPSVERVDRCSVLPGVICVTAGGAPTYSGAVGTVLLGGKATWYATPGFTAAAGPVLREVLGDWRGRYVTVESGGIEVVVQLTDWCACRARNGIPTLIDLSRTAFAALADPSAGVINVSIEIDGSPRPDPADDKMRDEVRDPLPATDVAP